MKLDSKILSQVFDSFNLSQAKYCVMHKYRDLPENIDGDVDIAIEKGSFDKLDTLIKRIAADHNVEIIQKIWHGYNKCAYLLSPLTIDDPFRLQLDFFTDFSIEGYPNLISNKVMLARRVKYRNFFVPEPEIEVPFLIMRRIAKNDFKLSHVQQLKQLMQKDPEVFTYHLCELLGIDLGMQVLEIIRSGNLEAFRRNIGKYRKALKKWSHRNTDVFYLIRYLLSQLNRAFYRLRFPNGLSVALIGPDGSGKSTIAASVLERVSGSFHGAKILYWRPNLLSAMGRIKFWNPPEEMKLNSTPHDHPKQNCTKSLIRFLYYLIDYWIGYLVRVYWAKVKKKIVIFDRYYYDYLVDLKRYQFNIPKWLPKLILPIIPAPDVVFYLKADPTKIFDRKQELSLEELQRQINKFSFILGTIPNAHVIKTNGPINETVKEVSNLVLKKRKELTESLLREG